jgi:hypothetical protein
MPPRDTARPRRRSVLDMIWRMLTAADDDPVDAPPFKCGEACPSLEVAAPIPADDCAICLLPLAESCVRTPCNHVFHNECLSRYMSVSRRDLGRRALCPLCRGPLSQVSGIAVRSTSGRPIEVVPLPTPGDQCHLDRMYRFLSLGGFAELPADSIFYLLSSNEDRHTPANTCMWRLTLPCCAILHINFRSEAHAAAADAWLKRDQWRRNRGLASAVSTGIPNGPYSGPVFSKAVEQGEARLPGSATWEGVYFAFIQLQRSPHTPAAPPAAAAAPLYPAEAFDPLSPFFGAGGVVAEAETGPRDDWDGHTAWAVTRSPNLWPV